jgi:SAM-dependent methyltransferase
MNGTSDLNTRQSKVFYLLDKKGLGLEIGPSHNPFAPKKMGYNVHVLDHASADELKRKYQGHGVNLDNIEDVDFVWNGEPLPKLIGRISCYDWIIASHVIEHVPDFVSFLQQCYSLLKPEGVLSLAIPDKRFCFDNLSLCSSIGNILDAYYEKRKKPTHGQVFEHFANASKRNGHIVWGPDGLGDADGLVHSFAEARDQWDKSVSDNEYIDVHCWRFTPSSFRLIISDLQSLGLIKIGIKSEFETVGCEFFVSLCKQDNFIEEDCRFSKLQKRNAENASINLFEAERINIVDKLFLKLKHSFNYKI